MYYAGEANGCQEAAATANRFLRAARRARDRRFAWCYATLPEVSKLDSAQTQHHTWYHSRGHVRVACPSRPHRAETSDPLTEKLHHAHISPPSFRRSAFGGLLSDCVPGGRGGAGGEAGGI